MAYIGTVEYDQGGTVRSLDGLAAVMYDNGATRNLLGANLDAVKYDDGGRFRTLLGMGQDPSVDMPAPDVGLDSSLTSAFPISYTPPSVAPSFMPFVPSPVVDTTSTPSAGTLVDTTPAAAAPPTASVLTSIFSGVKSVLSSASGLAQPKTAGLAVPLPGQPGYVAPVAASWFSQGTIVSGLPNWGFLAMAAGGGLLLMIGLSASGGGGSRRRRNPAKQFDSRRAGTRKDLARFIRQHPRASRREIISKFPYYRRQNPAELILMGANPRHGWAR